MAESKELFREALKRWFLPELRKDEGWGAFLDLLVENMDLSFLSGFGKSNFPMALSFTMEEGKVSPFEVSEGGLVFSFPNPAYPKYDFGEVKVSLSVEFGNPEGRVTSLVVEGVSLPPSSVFSFTPSSKVEFRVSDASVTKVSFVLSEVAQDFQLCELQNYLVSNEILQPASNGYLNPVRFFEVISKYLQGAEFYVAYRGDDGLSVLSKYYPDYVDATRWIDYERGRVTGYVTSSPVTINSVYDKIGTESQYTDIIGYDKKYIVFRDNKKEDIIIPLMGNLPPDDPGYVMQITPSSLDFPESGGSDSVYVSTEGGWDVEGGVASHSEGLSIVPVSALNLALSSNESSEWTQIEPNTVNVSTSGGSGTVQVLNNPFGVLSWSQLTGSGFASISYDSTKGVLNWSCEPNEYFQRQANFQFKGDNLPPDPYVTSLTIVQDGLFLRWSQGSIMVPSEGNFTDEVNIVTDWDGDVRIVVVDESTWSAPSWVSVTRREGSTVCDVSVSSANEGSYRRAQAWLQAYYQGSWNTEYTLVISQPAFGRVSPETLNVIQRGENKQVTTSFIVGSANIISMPDFCGLVFVGDKVLTFNFTINNTGSSREGDIIIRNGSEDYTVHVVQDYRRIWVEPETITFSKEGGVFRAKVTSEFETPWEVQVWQGEGSILSVRKESETSLYVGSSPNKENYEVEVKARLQVIENSILVGYCEFVGYVEPNEGGVIPPVTEYTFSVTPEVQNVSSNGSDVEFNVESTYPSDWGVGELPEWCSLAQKTSDKAVFNVATNTSGASRSATIRFYAEGGVTNGVTESSKVRRVSLLANAEGDIIWNEASALSVTPNSITFPELASSAIPVEVNAEGYVFSLNPSTLSFTAEGGTRTVAVTCNYPEEWSFTPPGESWVSVTKDSSEQVSVIVSENTSISSRNILIPFIVAGQTINLTVNQAGVSPVFTVSPTTATISAEGGSGSVSVTCNYPQGWSYENELSWVTVTKTEEGFTYQVSENSELSVRSGTITVFVPTSGSDPTPLVSQVFSISQSAAEAKEFTVSPGEVSLLYDETTFQVSVTSEYEEGFQIEYLDYVGDWILSRSVSGSVVTFTVAQNGTELLIPRTARINFYVESSEGERLAEAECRVSQSPEPAFWTDIASVSFGGEEDSVEVSVRNTYPYSQGSEYDETFEAKVEGLCPWVTSSWVGSFHEIISFDVTRNETGNTRVCSVTLYVENSEGVRVAEKVVTLRQSAYSGGGSSEGVYQDVTITQLGATGYNILMQVPLEGSPVALLSPMSQIYSTETGITKFWRERSDYLGVLRQIEVVIIGVTDKEELNKYQGLVEEVFKRHLPVGVQGVVSFQYGNIQDMIRFSDEVEYNASLIMVNGSTSAVLEVPELGISTEVEVGTLPNNMVWKIS